MFCQVIPIRRLPLKMDTLLYEVPESLADTVRIGHLVKIPFKKSFIAGIIINIQPNNSPSILLKPIEEIIHGEFQLPSSTLALIQQTAQYYLCSSSTLAQTALPDIPKKIKNSPPPRRANLPPSQVLPLRPRPSLIIYHDLTDKEGQISAIIAQTLSQKKSVILISPTIENAFKFFELYQKKYPQRAFLIHSKIAKTIYFQAFLNIYCHPNNSVVIGTKLALFAPLQNIGAIIVDQYHRSDYKQTDQNPRWDGRWAAQTLQELTGSSLYCFSAAPPIKMLKQISSSSSRLGRDESNLSNNKARLIDMNLEILNKNFSPLSAELLERIDAALKNKQQILLLTTKKGFASSLACQDCQYIFKCRACRSTFKADTQTLICPNCKTSEPLPAACPRCKGFRLKYTGMGIQRLAKLLQELYPDSAILKLDAETKTPRDDTHTHYPIILSTPSILNHDQFLLSQTIGMIGIISIDNLFSIGEFGIHEKIFHLLSEIQILANTSQCSLLCQTFLPEHPLLRAWLKGDVKSWIQHELNERKVFKYPPYSRLIKLIYKTNKPALTAKEPARFYQLLQRELPHPSIEIMPPMKARGSAKWLSSEIVIKIMDKKRVPDIYRALHNHLTESWTADVDPENL
ncbi:MAG: primosomal protein N' [Parcubacteria group bacterium]|nr:primosomal protein N' [Parcubacteria group bacterium]